MRRSRWLGGVMFGVAVAITACAGIVGVEDAQLDPTIGAPEAGTSSSSSSSGGSSSSGDIVDSATPETAAPDVAAPPCAGKDCPCKTKTDCIDPIFSACANGACHECSTSPDECPADQYCQPSTLTCVPGCKNEASCTGGQHCNTTIHRCVDCVLPTDCTGTKKCTESGVCADPCAGGAGCGGTQTCCGTTCVDFKNDRNNCNGCGNKCTGVSPLCCNGTCVDTANDKQNCGKCGMACSTTEGSPTCAGGTCEWACNAGYTHCKVGNTGCDTRTVDSTTQCGGCAINCNTRISNATGLSCQSSTCNYAACTPNFVDGDGNRANGCEATCGAVGELCCTNGPAPCDANTSRCDKITKKCAACLGKHKPCDANNDLCCNGCNAGSGQCM